MNGSITAFAGRPHAHDDAERHGDGGGDCIAEKDASRRLLFTSWRRATIETEAPGACVSATIWRFNASGYCRRFVGPGC
jgi:hypothetical protein